MHAIPRSLLSFSTCHLCFPDAFHIFSCFFSCFFVCVCFRMMPVFHRRNQEIRDIVAQILKRDLPGDMILQSEMFEGPRCANSFIHNPIDRDSQFWDSLVEWSCVFAKDEGNPERFSGTIFVPLNGDASCLWFCFGSLDANHSCFLLLFVLLSFLALFCLAFSVQIYIYIQLSKELELHDFVPK